MAVRNILHDGDELLRKKSRTVERFNARLKEQIADMIDTLHASGNGIGLAAPQVGLLKRIFVVDMHDEKGSLVFVNPEIINSEGEQSAMEGCLSVPGTFGEVSRPAKVTIKAQDADGEVFEMEAEDLTAVCICHENDHLNGVLFIDKVKGELLHE